MAANNDSTSDPIVSKVSNAQWNKRYDSVFPEKVCCGCDKRIYGAVYEEIGGKLYHGDCYLTTRESH